MFDLSKMKWGSESETPEVVEETPQEQPAEETPNEPEAQPVEEVEPEQLAEEVPPPPSEEPTPEWKAKFESPEKLWEAYNEVAAREPEVKEVEKPIEDELLKGLIDYYESGGDLTEYLEAKVVNYDNYSDEDILRLEFKKKYPSLGSSEINQLFERHLQKQYGFDEDDEGEMQYAQLQMKADAAELRTKFKDQQSKFKLPEPKKVATNDGPTEEELEAARKYQEQMEAMLKPVLSKYAKEPKITVKYGEGEPAFNYELKDWNSVEEIAMNEQKFWSLFGTNDGSNPVDWDKFIKVIAFAQNPDGYEKGLIGYGKNLGTEKVVGEITNPGKSGGKPAPTGPASLEDAMLAAIAASKR